MKKLILIILLASFAVSHAEERVSKSAYLKMRNFYLKQMEKAHPTPSKVLDTFSIYGERHLPKPMGFEESGSAFTNSNTIEDESEHSQRMQNESSVAVNPTNPNNMIASAVDYRAGSSTWIYVSHDGGYTWENQNLKKPFDNWRSTNDPSVTFGADGTAYLMYGGFEQNTGFGNFKGGNAIFVARSFDEGKNWEAHLPVVIHTEQQTADSSFEDKYYIESDNSPESDYFGRIYTPWKRVIAADSSTQIMSIYSDDKGSTWSDPVPISYRLPGTSEDTTFGQSFPLLEAAPNGVLHAVWNSGTRHSVGYNRSYDGGDTWDEPILLKKYNIFGTTKKLPNGWRHTVKGKVRAESYPIIRADHSQSENRGNIYLVWTADSIPNVYFSRSEDGGDTWSERVIVNQDTTNDQFWAWLAVDPLSGDIGVMYFDSRRDPNNMAVECWVSLSTDGGRTWTDRPASSTGSDLRLNPFAENSFAGDYSGMDFYDGIMYPSWVDMRYAVDDESDSDVFTAIVDTKAPMPPTELSTEIIADKPESVFLSWVCPTKRTFGQALGEDEYEIIIETEGTEEKKVDTLAAGSTEFLVEGLTPYEEYTFNVFASADGRISKIESVSGYPGGSRQLGALKITGAEGNDNKEALIDIEIPAVRKDGKTEIVNELFLRVYRDGENKYEISIPEDKVGDTYRFSDMADKEGRYRYSFEIFDEFKGIIGTSPQTEEVRVYLGKSILADDTDFKENFDNFNRKFEPIGKWTINGEFYLSDLYSYSPGEGTRYEGNQKDTLVLFPVDAKEPFRLEFWHAAVIHPSDGAFLQVSQDSGRTWYEKAEWNKTGFVPWGDGELNESDWKKEVFTFDSTGGDCLIRFVFDSNPLGHDAGWFIDDLRLSRQLTGVNDEFARDLSIYPNPCKETLFVRPAGRSGRVSVYNIFGQKVREVEILGKEEIQLDIVDLPPGTYFVGTGKNTAKLIKQ